MIKASFEVLQPASGQSFIVREFGKIAFGAPYHFHPEIELTYIIKGEGKRYVGNNMADFSSGDLVLLGPNLPHCWKIDNPLHEEDAAAIVIQFSQNFLGADFIDRPELQTIRKLLQRSLNGICFTGNTRTDVNKRLHALVNEKNSFRTMMSLLEILQRLATTTEATLLDAQRTITELTPVAEQERLNPVFAYMVDNFRKDVSLNKAASIANMTPNAFCKFFKKTTRKTFMETVIDYRVNYATQQLVQTDKPISEISFESGFGDVSHFYKMFKNKMHLSPLNYRKKFMRNLLDDAQRMAG